MSQQYLSKILQPHKYLNNVFGNNATGKVIDAFNYWFNVSKDKAVAVKEIADLVHSSTLLTDDIKDMSVIPHDKNSADSSYKLSTTLNSSLILLNMAVKKTYELNQEPALKILFDTFEEVFVSQCMSLHWRETLQCPSFDEYHERAVKRSSMEFIMPVQLMQLFSSSKVEISKLSGKLGLYWQIKEDYLNLCSQDYTNSKAYCNEITKGNFSYPVIHAIKTRPNDEEIFNIVRQRSENVELKRYCVSLLEQYGSLTFTRDTLHQMEKDIEIEMEEHGHNPNLLAFLNECRMLTSKERS